MRKVVIRWLASSLVATCSGATVTLASALTPTVAWQQVVPANRPGNVFSADGSVILLTTSTGFQVRRATDGVLLNTLVLPAASLSYEKMAFSPDKQFVALVFFTSAVGTIEIWRVSDSTLARTITTDAVRSFKAIDFSSNGLIATQERFAYGGGGYLRVHNAATGVLVKKLGPTVRNSNPVDVGFSPNGQYLAYKDTFTTTDNGLPVVRTSDWSLALKFGTGTYAGFLRWSPDGGSLWTDGYQQVRVPDGTVLQTLQSGSVYVTGFTPDNHHGLGTVYSDFQATNMIEFLRIPDGSPEVVYTFNPGTQVGSGQINSGGTLFTYGIASTDFTSFTEYVAKVPSL
jgi:hypothetical protein